MTQSRATAVSGALLLLTLACSKSETPSAPKEAPATQAAAPATPPPPPAPPAPAPGNLPAPPDVAAPPADAAKTTSGLASKVLTPGTGKDHPAASDSVEVHYTGWTTDGKMFDSSVKRGQPAKFPRRQRHQGLDRGRAAHGRRREAPLLDPGELAYGDNPGGGRPAGMLVFDVELLGIKRAQAARGRPRTWPPPPKNAKKTKSGLAYKVLKKGTGKEHPKADQPGEVHYTGWTTDGKMFDSSVARGQPATFPLDQRHPGLDRRRAADGRRREDPLLDPGNLAYDNPPRPGARRDARVRHRAARHQSERVAFPPRPDRSSAAPASSRRCWRRAVRTACPAGAGRARRRRQIHAGRCLRDIGCAGISRAASNGCAWAPGITGRSSTCWPFGSASRWAGSTIARVAFKPSAVACGMADGG